MTKTFRAGVVALAITGLLPTIPALANDSAVLAEQSRASIDVGRIKSVLKLTPEQEPYWPPVEVALRDLARQQAKAEPAGFVRRISNRVVSVVLDSAAIRRLAAAARPLIASLKPEQMRAASDLAAEMGLGPVVAALR
jgi:hypothetical protein